MRNKLEYALIFDLDGTLVDNSRYHQLAWCEFSRKYKNNLTAEDFLKIFGTTNKYHLEYILKRNIDDDELYSLAEEKEAIYRNLINDEFIAIEGLNDFLNTVKTKKIRTALATSAPKSNVDFSLEKLNLQNFFDVIIYDGMVKKGKPDPEIFITASQKLNIKNELCVVFEDSIFGVKAAKAASMIVVALTTSHSPKQLEGADLYIKNFNEISITKIEKLLRKNVNRKK
jgi:beta-phosphoglucomutase family hydrolase